MTTNPQTSSPTDSQGTSQGWKGIKGWISPFPPEYWLKAYQSLLSERNLLRESADKLFIIDCNFPQWKINAMALDGGGWAFYGRIEGNPQLWLIPIECLEFEWLTA